MMGLSFWDSSHDIRIRFELDLKEAFFIECLFFIMRICLIVSRLVDGYNNEILKVGEQKYKLEV
jgi:hypothetical protein